ncbi:MAG: M23 family metallopeptidase [bacterium]|nr:M23 family metallopeptidase [bacterium]
MSLGSLLLQPAKIRRASATPPPNGLMEDILDLVIQIAADCMKDGDISQILKEAAKAAGKRMADFTSGRFDSAWPSLRDWIAPFRTGLEDFMKTIPGDEDDDALDAFGIQLIPMLREKIDGFSLDQLRGTIEEFLDILENQWGFTTDFIQAQVWELLDDIATRLENSGAGTGENTKQMAVTIRRIKKKIHGSFTFPGFNADALAGNLMEFLSGFSAEPVSGKTACYTKNAGDVLTAMKAIADLVPYTGFGQNTVGAAACPDSDEDYLWYANWLVGGTEKDAADWVMYVVFSILQVPYPQDGICIRKSDNTLIRKKFFGDVTELGTVTDGAWHQVDPLNKFTFSETLDAGDMEKWAKHTNYPCDFVEMLLHLFSSESGDWLANALNMALLVTDGIVKPATCKPVPPQVVFSARILINIVGSLPGIHTKASFGLGLLNWLTKVGTTALEANVLHAFVHSIRDALLACFTLGNHKDPGSGNPPENWKQVGGLVTLLTGILTSVGLVKIIPEDYYGLASLEGGSGKNYKMGLGYWLLGSIITGLIGATAGTLGGQAIARNGNSDLWKGPVWEEWAIQWGLASLVTFVSFWPSYYMGVEGKTDDGKYNPGPGADFSGYPVHTASPYKLPFRRGQTIRCIQGNQGIWSHNDFSRPFQVYAYDFDLDQDVEILASRDGTVVDYFDWVPNDQNVWTTAPTSIPSTIPNQTTTTNWNFVLIRHDIPDAVHDKDEGGVAATTYCVYGHGRQGSVRAAFNSRSTPVLPLGIIGTTVNQGDVIMKAGSTGISMYNHIHIDVRTGPAVPSIPGGSPAVLFSGLNNRTIPFVFRDAEHKAPMEFILKMGGGDQDGVPKSLNWYESDNG